MAGRLQRRFFFAAVFVAVLILSVSMFWRMPVMKVSPESVAAMMDKGEIPTIIDVRNKAEFRNGHIPFAMNVALLALFFEHDELAVSQKSNVIVYCKGGFRARIASIFLRLVGFESIYIIDGHLSKWMELGYPVVVGD